MNIYFGINKIKCIDVDDKSKFDHHQPGTST